MTTAEIIQKFGQVKRSGDGFKACCPAHEDQTESLSITEMADGSTRLKCFAGCTTEQVCRAVGLAVADLFVERRESKQQKEKPVETVDWKRPTKVYPYVSAEGTELYENRRYRVTRTWPDGRTEETKTFRLGRRAPNRWFIWGLKHGWHEVEEKKWVWRGDDPDRSPSAKCQWFDELPVVLYRLPEVRAAAEAGRTVWLTEGEKDADSAVARGLTATTNAMGAGGWRPEYTEQLAGAKVAVVLDRDLAGYKRGLELMAALPEAKFFEPTFGKDLTDHLESKRSMEDLAPVDEAYLRAKVGEAPPTDKAPPSEAEEGQDDGFALTDLGNAERLVARLDGTVRYVNQFGAWLHWDGVRWKHDDTGGGLIQHEIGKMARWMQTSEVKKMKAAGLRLEGLRVLSACEQMARRMPGVPVHPDDLDKPKDKLVVANGVLNLRTGLMEEPRRDDLITVKLDIPYDARAEAPIWNQYLERTFPDQAMRDAIWNMAGYILTGETKEQVLFFFYGEGRTGKTTLVNTLSFILGELAKTLETKKIMASRMDTDIPTHFARLKGARMVVAEEVRIEDRLDEGLVKALTGNGKIQTRFMRQDAFEFEPNFKLILTGNHRPTIIGTDDGIWRRFVMVPFLNQISEEQKDKDLDVKLRAEKSGILRWLIEGSKRWYEQGLLVTDEMKSVRQEYAEEMDSLGYFFQAKCTLDRFDDSCRARVKDLYRVYREWAKEVGETYTMSQRAFSIKLATRSKDGIAKVRLGNGEVWFRGLMLRVDDDPLLED